MRNRMCIAFGTAVSLLAISLTNWGGLPWGALLGLRLPGLLLVKTAPQALSSGAALLLCAWVEGRHGASTRVRVGAQAMGSLVIVVTTLALSRLPGSDAYATSLGAAIATAVLLALGAACGVALWLWGLALLEAGQDQAGATRLVVGTLVAYALLYAIAYALAIDGRILFLAACVAVSGCLYASMTHGMRVDGAVAGTRATADGTSGEASVGDGPGAHGDGGQPATLGDAPSRLSTELICVMASVFAFSFVRTTALASIRDTDFINRLGAVLGVAFAMVALAWWLSGRRQRTTGRRLDAIGMYRVAFPVIVTIAALLPLVSPSLIVIAAAVLHAAFFVILATLIVLSATCAEDHGVSRGVALGILGAGTFLSVSLSTLIAYLIYRGGAASQANVLVCALAIVYVLAMAYVAVQRRARDARAGADCDAVRGPDRRRTASGAALLDDLYGASCDAAIARFALTDREGDVLRLLARGYTQRGIAESLCVTENTVRTHLRNLYRKLEVHSRQELLELLERL